MSIDITIGKAHAWLTPPDGAAVSKLTVNGWLLPGAPNTAVTTKTIAHVWLMPVPVSNRRRQLIN